MVSEFWLTFWELLYIRPIKLLYPFKQALWLANCSVPYQSTDVRWRDLHSLERSLFWKLREFVGKLMNFLIIKQIKKPWLCSVLLYKALRKRLEHSRSREKHSPTARVSPYTSFVLSPLPACFIQQNRAQSRLLYLLIIIKFLYYARSDWLKQCTLSESRCTEGLSRHQSKMADDFPNFPALLEWT